MILGWMDGLMDGGRETESDKRINIKPKHTKKENGRERQRKIKETDEGGGEGGHERLLKIEMDVTILRNCFQHADTTRPPPPPPSYSYFSSCFSFTSWPLHPALSSAIPSLLGFLLLLLLQLYCFHCSCFPFIIWPPPPSPRLVV